jgi:hypothetical protein
MESSLQESSAYKVNVITRAFFEIMLEIVPAMIVRVESGTTHAFPTQVRVASARELLRAILGPGLINGTLCSDSTLIRDFQLPIFPSRFNVNDNRRFNVAVLPDAVVLCQELPSHHSRSRIWRHIPVFNTPNFGKGKMVPGSRSTGKVGAILNIAFQSVASAKNAVFFREITSHERRVAHHDCRACTRTMISDFRSPICCCLAWH